MNVTLKFIFLVVVVYQTLQADLLYGQANHRDSIYLSPEFQKAIESGVFIQPEFPNHDLNTSTYELPLLMDFSEFIQLDTVYKLDYRHLPIGVFKLYEPIYELSPEFRSFYLYDHNIEEFKRVYPGGMKFNAESILRYVFWKSERAKVRNRKRANAWKYYNNYP